MPAFALSESPENRPTKSIAEPETSEQLQERIDELARCYAETHDEQVDTEIKALTLRLADRWNPQ